MDKRPGGNKPPEPAVRADASAREVAAEVTDDGTKLTESPTGDGGPPADSDAPAATGDHQLAAAVSGDTEADSVTAADEADGEAVAGGRGDDSGGEATAGRRMAMGALIISLFLFLGKISSYARSMLIAGWFGGAGQIAKADAFYKIQDVIVSGTFNNFEKIMRPAYLPQFVREKNQGTEAQAWQLSSYFSNLLLAVLVVLTLLVEVLAPQIVQWLWSKLAADPENYRVTVLLVRVMAPAVIPLTMSLMPELTLHAYKRFTIPAVAGFLYSTSLVVGLVMGIFFLWNPQQPNAILAAASGVVLGGTLRFAGMLPGVWQQLKHWRPLWRARLVPGASTVLGLVPPVLVGMAAAYLRGIADTVYTDRIGSGMYSYLKWARQMGDSSLQILPLAVSFVVYPFLSEWAARNEKDRLADALVGMTRVMAFIFLPISVGLMFMARPVITIMFEHGDLTSEGAALSALALLCYAPGLLFFALEGSINKWYFALQDTKTPNYWGAAMACLNILMGYVGVMVLWRHGHISDAWALAAVALAVTLSKSLKVVILYGLIRRRIGAIDRGKALRFAGRLGLSTLLMGVVIYFIGQGLQAPLAAWQPPFAAKKLRMLALLAVVVTGGGGVFLLSAAVLKIEELAMLGEVVKRKVRGKLRAGQAKGPGG
jgi:putative peptidoglycan lipid II flippase